MKAQTREIAMSTNYAYHRKPAAARTIEVPIKVTATEVDTIRAWSAEERVERALRLPLIDADLADLGIATARERREAQIVAAREARRQKIVARRLGEDREPSTGAGRHSTVAGESRSTRVSVYLPVDAFKIVSDRARKLLLTQSDYLRRTLLGISFTEDEQHIAPSRREAQIEAAARFAWEAKRAA